MTRTSFAHWPCSIARTVDVIGDGWTPLILREAFYGTTRFDDFERTLRVSRNVLTRRLSRLVDEGLLERQEYQQNPPRHDYVLTVKGRELFPVLAAMMAWGDRWVAPNEGPPVLLRHLTCGHDVHAEVVCSHCREPLEAAEVAPRLGPGFPDRMRDAVLATGRFSTVVE
ncbi:MAG TPA: helix-turn-helix domain-containing protein [Aeromicrobium sp.]|nr:helix-turn-helix domain-containing protein [Aeromicrobium sp.]